MQRIKIILKSKTSGTVKVLSNPHVHQVQSAGHQGNSLTSVTYNYTESNQSTKEQLQELWRSFEPEASLKFENEPDMVDRYLYRHWISW